MGENPRNAHKHKEVTAKKSNTHRAQKKVGPWLKTKSLIRITWSSMPAIASHVPYALSR